MGPDYMETTDSLIRIIEGLSAALAEQCDFVSQVLGEDYTSRDSPIQMIEFYNI